MQKARQATRDLSSGFPAGHRGGETGVEPGYFPWTNGVLIEDSPEIHLRLFCFPYAGSGASVFRGWSAEIAAGIEVCPIQFPGRENRWGEPPFTRMSSLVEALAEALWPLLDTPFAFFGHSMGALIGFELARHLRRKGGKEAAHLIASGARAPQLPDPDEPIHHLPDAALIERLLKLRGIPGEVLGNDDLMKLLLPALRADLELCEMYRYTDEEPLNCRVSAYAGRHDQKAPSEDVAAWGAQTANEFSLRVFPGDHFFLTGARQPVLRSVSVDLLGTVIQMRELTRRS